ncbi:MAG: DUF58 domain-containing protein [Pseudomonadota bacterium]
MAEPAAAALRRDAERQSAALPALLAESQRLAATIVLGAHGRRRPGFGESFWQYRRASPGDPLPSVDWRRSARSDALFVRETEWEAAQTVVLWCDRSRSMAYRSKPDLPTKLERATVLTAATAILLNRGGGIGLLEAGDDRPRSGDAQLTRIVIGLSRALDADSAMPPAFEAARGGRAIFVGDFFGEESRLVATVRAAADHGVTGMLLQVNDPAEDAFPFDGRVLFESMGGALRYETDRAGAIREDYRTALAERRGRLQELARATGWRFETHRTDQSAAPALMWIARGLSTVFASGARS